MTTSQPAEYSDLATARAARKPIHETDVFPCAFCGTHFNSRQERHTHELLCPKADEPVKRDEARELPTPFTVEVDAILTQGELFLMLHRAGLKLVDRGENRAYLLTVEPQSLLSRVGLMDAARAAVNAEAARITRSRDAWYGR